MTTKFKYRGIDYTIFSQLKNGQFEVIDIQPAPENVETILGIWLAAEKAIKTEPVGSSYLQ